MQGKPNYFKSFVFHRQINVWSWIDAYRKEIYFAFFVIFNLKHNKTFFFGIEIMGIIFR